MTDSKRPTAEQPVAVPSANDGFRAALSTGGGASSHPSGGAARSGTTDEPLINVQPVRRGELQPSYAQNLGLYPWPGASLFDF